MLVGRERELAAGSAALEAALRGDGRLVVLSGEPGIGKTRVAEELDALAHARGFTVAWGRAWDDDDAPALLPWLQVLRAIGEDLPNAEPQFAAFDAVAQTLQRAAGAQPLFVVLDDLHAADASSLRLLRFVVRSCGGRGWSSSRRHANAPCRRAARHWRRSSARPSTSRSRGSVATTCGAGSKRTSPR